MAERIVWHIRPNAEGGGWKLTRFDGAEPEQRYDTRTEALAAANKLGLTENERGQVIVHRRDGAVDYEWTYGDEHGINPE